MAVQGITKMFQPNMIASMTVVVMLSLASARADEVGAMKFPIPNLKTSTMGRVPNASEADLLRMHQSPYILHARDGRLKKLHVEKSRLPDDPQHGHQGILVAMASDGAVYVCLLYTSPSPRAGHLSSMPASA